MNKQLYLYKLSDNKIPRSNSDETNCAEQANQLWVDYFGNLRKLAEEEDAKIEELCGYIAEAKAEEKMLLGTINKRKELLTRFVATYGSPALKDE